MRMTLLLALCGLLWGVEGAAETLTWDASPYSREVTPCDLAAAHPSDPDAIVPGISQDDMNFATATEACEAAVAADPENPRLRYQLVRVYVYSGQTSKADPHWEVALAAEYPQALFVSGYMLVRGSRGVSRDSCRAEKLLRRSAQYGRLAAQVGYARYAIDGEFEGCDAAVDPAAVRAFLASAAESTSDYYRSMLIDTLRKEASRIWPESQANSSAT
ncbi:tetratricopeptide repeat protein [Candidatus Foliamicus sp.]